MPSGSVWGTSVVEDVARSIDGRWLSGAEAGESGGGASVDAACGTPDAPLAPLGFMRADFDMLSAQPRAQCQPGRGGVASYSRRDALMPDGDSDSDGDRGF